jgi:hypothetical protein
MEWLIAILLFVTVISLSGMALGYVEGRRKHRLELRKEERRLVEARTREIEAQNRQAELEYQSALAELERFDRRGGKPDPDLPALAAAPATGADPEPAAEPAADPSRETATEPAGGP